MVETIDAAQACVELLRREKLGVATFMILVLIFFFKGKFLHNYLPTVTLIYYHTDEVVNLPNYWLLQLYNSVFIELFPSVS